MGASASSLTEEPDFSGPSTGPKLDDIPESCIALVLSHLDPPAIAKLAGLNRAFRAASSADFIWVPKLPSTYAHIIDKLSHECAGDRGKMDIYARLSRPNSFDGGTKEVWIDKRGGGVCLAISSKAMDITGIDDRRYWNHIPTDESRFQTVAYLQQIWWVEVDGGLDFHFPAGSYSLFFRLKLGKIGKNSSRRLSNSETVHGWDLKPAQFQLSTHDGQTNTARYMLDNLGTWTHYHIGDFVVEDPTELTTIKFSMTQIDCTHTKGGLCVDSVLIVPSSLGKESLPVDVGSCK